MCIQFYNSEPLGLEIEEYAERSSWGKTDS